MVLARYGLARLTWLDRATGRVVRRYEHAHPGDLVHVDIKKLGRIPDGGGHKVLGRALGRCLKKATKPGYTYLHHAVDDQPHAFPTGLGALGQFQLTLVAEGRMATAHLESRAGKRPRTCDPVDGPRAATSVGREGFSGVLQSPLRTGLLSVGQSDRIRGCR
jgi:hypothetical protein